MLRHMPHLAQHMLDCGKARHFLRQTTRIWACRRADHPAMKGAAHDVSLAVSSIVVYLGKLHLYAYAAATRIHSNYKYAQQLHACTANSNTM